MTLDASAFASVCRPVPAAKFLGLLLRTGFSPEAYRDAYGDLAALDWDATQALGHFFNSGLRERRVAPMVLDRAALLALARLPLDDTAFRAALLTSLAGHLFDGCRHPYAEAIAERWPTVRSLGRHGARPYFLAGDSHSNQWALTGTRDAEWLVPIHLPCTAGSAMGLGNPASRAGYGPLLRQAIETISRLAGADDVPFLLKFGQVDIEFVYHFRRVRDGKREVDLDDYRAFCDMTVERYLAFMASLFAAARRPLVHVVSVFPPALSDAAWKGGYANGDVVSRETDGTLDAVSEGIRGLEVADLRARTDIHSYFNDTLCAACRRLGFSFVDGFTPFLGEGGVVDPFYVVPEAGGAEHHLDDRRTYKVVQRLIWDCIGA